MQKIIINVALLLLLLHQTFALTADKAENLLLMADKMTFSNKQKIGTYLGHVYLKQGSSTLHANKAWTYTNNNHQLDKAIALGNATKQALFETLMEGQKDKLKGAADKISYFPNKQLIRLEGHAFLSQGKNTYQAPLIIYDITKQRLISQKTSKSRSHITIEETIA